MLIQTIPIKTVASSLFFVSFLPFNFITHTTLMGRDSLSHLAQATLKPNLFPYKHPNNLKPSHSSYPPPIFKPNLFPYKHPNILKPSHSSYPPPIFKPNLFPYKYPNILKPSHSSYLPAYEDGTDSVPKHHYIKFRRWEITRRKAYNMVVLIHPHIHQIYPDFVISELKIQYLSKMQ